MRFTFQRWTGWATRLRWQWQVDQIVRQKSALQRLSDAELKRRSLGLRYDALSGLSSERLAIDAFALVREAARRTLGMEHYAVQLQGGLAMQHGNVAVMQTGEGKTLTATLPMYLAAIGGQGAHLATANDYLAVRDAEAMRPVFECLGLTVGVIQSDTTRRQRAGEYGCDVTYTTAREIGFDFLRDRLQQRRREAGAGNGVAAMLAGSDNLPGSATKAVQRGLNFLLVDEADSILIDEAKTPLIVSAPSQAIEASREALYRWSAASTEKLQAGVHYRIDSQTRQVELTAQGRQQVRSWPPPDRLCEVPLPDLYEQIEQALFVNQHYHRDRQYVVRDGEIVIVDEFSGRLAEGRKWRAGLHQAIEAREGLRISSETGESARITVQDLCRRYHRLAGMTGTADAASLELRSIYRLGVVAVPTHRPPQRQHWPDQVFGTEPEKWDAIEAEIESLHTLGRPVLVGTRSIDKSEELSRRLDCRGIQHDVLNARHLVREAEIIARAGQVGRVTVATNMAGRGTDIKVSPEALARGGMHVICTERHESSRIDRQLIGRCGRQGDPGSFRQFHSLEDDLIERGLRARAAARLLQYRDRSKGDLARLAPLFHKAQQHLERRNFQGRKLLLHQERLRHEVQREMGQDPYLDSAGA